MVWFTLSARRIIGKPCSGSRPTDPLRYSRSSGLDPLDWEFALFSTGTLWLVTNAEPGRLWSNRISSSRAGLKHYISIFKFLSLGLKGHESIELWLYQAFCHWCQCPCRSENTLQYWKVTVPFPLQYRDIFLWNKGIWQFMNKGIKGIWVWTCHSSCPGFKSQKCLSSLSIE